MIIKGLLRKTEECPVLCFACQLPEQFKVAEKTQLRTLQLKIGETLSAQY